MAELATRNNPQIRVQVARNRYTSINLLISLSEDEDAQVRRYVGRNPNTPEDVIRKLAIDKNYWVRVGVAGNKNAPADILAYLVDDKEELVKGHLSENPSSSAESLAILALTPLAQSFVAENRNTDASTLEYLTMHGDWGARWAIARSSRASGASLLHLSKNPEEDIRLAVAENHVAPAEVLELLVQDESEKVCQAALANARSRQVK